LSGEIKEWFEYQGEPYKFKIYIDVNRTLEGDVVLSEGTQKKLLNLVDEYKDERSWLDELSVGVRHDVSLAISPAITNCIAGGTLYFEEPGAQTFTHEAKLAVVPAITNCIAFGRIGGV